MLIKCAETALNSKLLSSYKTFFAEIVVSAVEKLDTSLLDKELIGIKEVTGGSINDSFLVSGVAFKKTFSYAGFEQQPKNFINPKIIILKIELELKSEKENAEIRINNVEDFQSIVDAEWQIIYEKLKKFMMLELKSYYQSFPLEIWLLNGSLIVVFSALEESPMKISTESLNPLELFSKPQSITSRPMYLELAESSKKSKSELKGTIFSRIAQM